MEEDDKEEEGDRTRGPSVPQVDDIAKENKQKEHPSSFPIIIFTHVLEIVQVHSLKLEKICTL